MRADYDPEKAEDVIVSHGSESITDEPRGVFGCTISESVWEEHSRHIGRAINDAREDYDSKISKIGSFSSHQSLHPWCIREGNLLNIGFAENLSVKYPFRIKSIDYSSTNTPIGPAKAEVSMEIQPCFGGESKIIDYVYIARHGKDNACPSIHDEVPEMSLYNPSCELGNRNSDLDPRAVHLYEDNHILLAFDQNEDIVANKV